MYAIFWTSSNGQTGNGEYILDEESLCAWLDKLRTRYPEMKHWGQLALVSPSHTDSVGCIGSDVPNLHRHITVGEVVLRPGEHGIEGNTQLH